MQKHLLYIPLIALSSALALSACSDEEVNALNPDQPIGEKSPIELSVGGVDTPNAATRAVITDGKDKTLKAFDVNTKIFMVMKSEYGAEDFNDPDNPHVAKYTVTRGDVTANSTSVVFDDTNKRYWDDAHARSSQLDIWAYAQMGQSWTPCTFEVPNSGGTGMDAYKDHTYDTSTKPSPIWTKGNDGEIYPAIRTWRASHYTTSTASNYRCQDATSVLCQDLLFSNNLTNNPIYNPSSNAPDNRLKFNFTTRKFPKEGEANMIFYHAMSKITIHIKKGDGYTDADPFAFTTGNVKLMGFNTEGLFNIKTGQFEYIHEHYDIPQIYKWNTAADGDAYTLQALVIPNVDGNADGLTDANSRLVDDSNAKSFEFVIDNNKYEISQDQLYEALKAKTENASIVANDKVDLEAGKHYIFTFTVGKTQIKNITAQVVGWEDVVADEFDASNARIKLQLEERGTPVTSSVDIYRAEDNPSEVSDTWESYKWTTGYVGNKNVFKEVSGSWKLESDWFWDNNKTFYHFRALMPSNTSIVQEKDNEENVVSEYVALTHAETDYTDILWGAPMRDKAENEDNDAATLKWYYGPTKNGFDAKDDGTIANALPSGTQHQIYQAIGPTKDAIKLILFHMMSDVTFKIQTTTGADKVNLGTGTGTDVTTIKLEKIHKKGNLYMGNGLVKGSDTPADFTFTPSSSAPDANGILTWPHYGAIPQSLENVVLVITTPDHNQYKVAMKDVLATTVNPVNLANPYSTVGGSGDDKNKYKIDRWYPGFKYTYTFTLKKTGITDLQVTILDWETVVADNQDVVIQ